MRAAPNAAGLDYAINDADNHFNEPEDCFARYIDPKDMDLAICPVAGPDGSSVMLYAGRPSRFSVAQVTFSKAELEKLLGRDSAIDALSEQVAQESRGVDASAAQAETVPGMLLNRMNPLKGLSPEARADFIEEFRHKSEAYGNRDLRLALMDEQGIDKAVMFPARAHDIEYEFADNLPALYANVRAFNRWMFEEVGYNVENRMFLPPYIPLADPDLAVEELESVLERGARMIQTKSGHAHGGADNPSGGRSVADPIFDRFWSIANEASVRYAVHLGGTDYQKYGADWSYDPQITFGEFDAFQWVHYWGDRPAMELTSALVLQNFFGRFPNIQVLLSEQGSVWVPYTLRKMDHAFLLGRKARWHDTGDLDARPSEIFKQSVYVTPFPEEGVQRVINEVGIDSIVFGSDFPHGEGLAHPIEYVGAQLGALSDREVRRIMRDNMENFLTPCLT